MQSKYMLRVVDDDIESPYQIVPEIFDFCCERFYITLLTPYEGHHSACCVTSYGLHLNATPLTSYMTS